VATNGKKPRDLLAERINRLEKQGAETNKRLDQVVAILGSIPIPWLGKAENWSATANYCRRSPNGWIALPMRSSSVAPAIRNGWVSWSDGWKP